MSVAGKFQFGVTQCSSHSIPELLDELRVMLADAAVSPRVVLCLNAHIYNLAVEDPGLLADLNAARIVAADGMVIVWLAPLFGVRLKQRCNMTEAFRQFLEDRTMPPSTAILIGCTLEEAEAAAANAMKSSDHCRIVATFSGFLNNEEYARVLSENRNVDFIFLGMGTPKTERLSALAAQIAPRSIVWGIGGGTIRIYAGKMKEAPALWRRLGLQWMHRLCCDPASLWRRYIIGNPRFLWRVLRARWRRR